MAAPVIQADNLGIDFFRNRRRKMSLREMIYTGGTSHNKETFKALDQVSFTVQPGEAVGLIGGNGSGKSTLLKMIAGVLLPDHGSVRVRGGVAPLIELTGGFIGELSARENVYLTSGLHGLTKEQVDERFESIIDFAGPQVRAALDTPFRHFSSGMQVRLGFAVITTLDEPIVLVDEVLAVGDRAFREKCYTRMESMLSGGKTLFLVSHSESDLRRFAKRGLYLQQGRLVGDGDIEDVLEQYNADADAGT
ncbi:ABC transporter ATP-binding protein [Knoellia koreensis]|jgi:ABC-2 type transport system ATP-binding protein|uniref:ABC transporter ATP-binding protein n=1 Tax=Knoellia koreensis TaxID=2730921 RepID=A0A849HIA9_9MICO|nr:ABC transporter ATP-binding protein [Knoellia sp. DB2414S]NNM46393.1 ABC transporter ATP-binding protein [Knoellia sp. DB2414S]